MVDRIDEVDKRILYYLTQDARHTSAPDIAEEVDLSPPTVRNRVRRLEDDGVIEGYHAHVNYERGNGLLTNQYVCSAPATEREELAQRILEIPGVVNVRVIMSGRGDLRIKAVGEDTSDLTRIAQDLTALGIEIDDEDLVYREYFRPYARYGPRDEEPISPVTGVAGLAGDAEVIEVVVREDAPIAGTTLQAANSEGLVTSDVLVVRIDRDGEPITPAGETTIEVDDFVTIHSRSGIDDEILRAFTG